AALCAHSVAALTRSIFLPRPPRPPWRMSALRIRAVRRSTRHFHSRASPPWFFLRGWKQPKTFRFRCSGSLVLTKKRCCCVRVGRSIGRGVRGREAGDRVKIDERLISSAWHGFLVIHLGDELASLKRQCSIVRNATQSGANLWYHPQKGTAHKNTSTASNAR